MPKQRADPTNQPANEPAPAPSRGPDASAATRGALENLVDRLISKVRDLEAAEQRVKDLKAHVEDLSEREIPDLMNQVGYDEVKTASGYRVTLEQKLFTSVNKDDMPGFVEWLDEHGHGGIATRDIVISFDRKKVKEALALLEDLRKRKFLAKQESTIHWATLRKWTQEMLAKQNEVPDLDDYNENDGDEQEPKIELPSCLKITQKQVAEVAKD